MTIIANKQEIYESVGEREYVTIRVGGQLFGIPVLDVHDILRKQPITKVPLAQKEIAGIMNIRGCIVTVINVHTCLDLPPHDPTKKIMNLVISYQGEQYSLQVDSVGEVMSLSSGLYEKNPPTLKESWRQVSDGIYRLQDELLIVLNVEQLLSFCKGE
jgi:purine-binding chemotaxis protein CheW